MIGATSVDSELQCSSAWNPVFIFAEGSVLMLEMVLLSSGPPAFPVLWIPIKVSRPTKSALFSEIP